MTEYVLGLHDLSPDIFQRGLKFLENLRTSNFNDLVQVMTRLYTRCYTGFFSPRFHRVFLEGLTNDNLTMNSLRPLFQPSYPLQAAEISLIRNQRQIDVMTMYNTLVAFTGGDFADLFIDQQQKYLSTIMVTHDITMCNLPNSIIFVPIQNDSNIRQVAGMTLRDVLNSGSDYAKRKYVKELIMFNA